MNRIVAHEIEIRYKIYLLCKAFFQSLSEVFHATNLYAPERFFPLFAADDRALQTQSSRLFQPSGKTGDGAHFSCKAYLPEIATVAA